MKTEQLSDSDGEEHDSKRPSLKTEMEDSQGMSTIFCRSYGNDSLSEFTDVNTILLGSQELFSDNEFSQGMQLSVLCLKHNIESNNFTGDTDQFPEGEIALDMLYEALHSETAVQAALPPTTQEVVDQAALPPTAKQVDQAALPPTIKQVDQAAPSQTTQQVDQSVLSTMKQVDQTALDAASGPQVPPSLSDQPISSKRRLRSAKMNRKAQRASLYTRRSNAQQKETVYIDLEKLNPQSPEQVDSPIWISNEHMKLRERHREVLRSERWLCDDIVNAAQSLLKQKSNINGLQPVCATRTLSLDVQQSDFIQVLHNGYNHWLVVSSIGTKKDGEVYVYDSMYCNTTPEVKKIVAAILFTKLPRITLKFVDVQMQCGTQDCGLFAIAFATALCLGKQPGQLTFHQDQMRSHLLRCLESQDMTMFPVKRERRSGYRLTVKGEQSYPVFCTCRLPVLENVTMVQCTSCKMWCHAGACVSVDKEALTNRKAIWTCPECPLPAQ